MKRSVRLNINYANKGKLNALDSVMTESIKVVNLYIDSLWDSNDKNLKFVNFKVETWLSATLQQALGKQALEIVRSQRKKKKKTKPIFKFPSINLDSRMVKVEFDLNSFDVWIRLTRLGEKIKLNIPSRKHKMFLKYKDWNRLGFIRLVKLEDKFYIDFIYEKESPTKVPDTTKIGLDVGYKKLLACSNGNIYGGKELNDIYLKLSSLKQNSKAFKRTLKFRTNKTNEIINSFIEKEKPTSLVIEDLKNVKRNSKLPTKVMNKVQRWTYSRVIKKLDEQADQRGLSLVKVSPAYTSQQCSKCGAIDEKSRSGERYSCRACGFEMDADINASINILKRGVYRPSKVENNIC
jgi:putative transposase